MENWISKEGYETRLLASSEDLNAPRAEIQLVRFQKGKFEHYHKEKTEFFYFTAGKGKVILDNEERGLRPGISLIVKPGVKHTFINESENELLEAIMVKTNNNPEDTYQD